MIKTIIAATLFATAFASAAPNGAQVSAAQDAVVRAGFAAPETPAARVPEPKSASIAGQPSVAITSFNMTGNNSHVAEICGLVSGASSDFSVVRISVDPSEKNPGIYNTLAGADGSFCAVVVTYTRQADASVKGMDRPFSAAATSGPSGR
ncbi:MAG: hypothetical protein ACHQ2Z_08635 [Elusimicrobiota bacterium]